MTRYTDAQVKFVDLYLANGQNATEAYVLVYQSTRATANANASRLLAQASIKALVAEKQAYLAARLAVTPERVLREYARIAFADQRKLMTWGPSGVTLIKSGKLSDDDAAAVAEVSETRTKDGGSLKLKTHSKTSALEALAKTLNLFPAQSVNIDARNQTIYTSDALIASLLRAKSGLIEEEDSDEAG